MHPSCLPSLARLETTPTELGIDARPLNRICATSSSIESGLESISLDEYDDTGTLLFQRLKKAAQKTVAGNQSLEAVARKVKILEEERVKLARAERKSAIDKIQLHLNETITKIGKAIVKIPDMDVESAYRFAALYTSMPNGAEFIVKVTKTQKDAKVNGHPNLITFIDGLTSYLFVTKPPSANFLPTGLFNKSFTYHLKDADAMGLYWQGSADEAAAVVDLVRDNSFTYGRPLLKIFYRTDANSYFEPIKPTVQTVLGFDSQPVRNGDIALQIEKLLLQLMNNPNAKDKKAAFDLAYGTAPLTDGNENGLEADPLDFQRKWIAKMRTSLLEQELFKLSSEPRSVDNGPRIATLWRKLNLASNKARDWVLKQTKLLRRLVFVMQPEGEQKLSLDEDAERKQADVVSNFLNYHYVNDSPRQQATAANATAAAEAEVAKAAKAAKAAVKAEAVKAAKAATAMEEERRVANAKIQLHLNATEPDVQIPDMDTETAYRFFALYKLLTNGDDKNGLTNRIVERQLAAIKNLRPNLIIFTVPTITSYLFVTGPPKSTFIGGLPPLYNQIIDYHLTSTDTAKGVYWQGSGGEAAAIDNMVSTDTKQPNHALKLFHRASEDDYYELLDVEVASVYGRSLNQRPNGPIVLELEKLKLESNKLTSSYMENTDKINKRRLKSQKEISLYDKQVQSMNLERSEKFVAAPLAAIQIEDNKLKELKLKYNKAIVAIDARSRLAGFKQELYQLIGGWIRQSSDSNAMRQYNAENKDRNQRETELCELLGVKANLEAKQAWQDKYTDAIRRLVLVTKNTESEAANLKRRHSETTQDAPEAEKEKEEFETTKAVNDATFIHFNYV
jgi:hypothetical protein